MELNGSVGYNLVASSFRQSFRLRSTLNQWFMRVASFFFGARIWLGTILGRFSINYFSGLGLRIRVRVWVRVSVSVRVWVRVSIGVGVRVSVVIWSG